MYCGLTGAKLLNNHEGTVSLRFQQNYARKHLPLSPVCAFSSSPGLVLIHLIAFSQSVLFSSFQGCGTLRPPDHGARPETRAPGFLHHTQQHRLLPERTEPQGDPGTGGQLPAPGQVHVRHHHSGKRGNEVSFTLLHGFQA